MKKLILIRHGKSNWKVPVEDHERPLQQKGVVNSHQVFEKLSKYLPERFLIWSSTAKRAVDTAKIFTENLCIPNELVVLKNNLYTFDWRDLSSIIKNCDNYIPNLIIFGHNNAITDFVNKFGNKFFENVPTSGGIILTFNEDNWEQISQGDIEGVFFPKQQYYAD